MDPEVRPAEPYRGLEPYRFCDQSIFFERQTDTIRLLQLVTIYRGSLLYGESGTGKSSLINAGLIPRVIEAGMTATRVRVQPIEGHELVVERISRTGRSGDWLPSPFARDDEPSSRVVASAGDFPARLQSAAQGTTSLLIFDQFEELVTLVADASAADAATRAQENVVKLLVALLRDPALAVRILFVFREDYLARLDLLFYHCPELPDQFLRLTPPASESLTRIIRGPFVQLPGHWKKEIDERLAERLVAELTPAKATHRINLSQVQIVCLQLWRAADPAAELAHRGVQGLVDAFLSDALRAFAPPQRRAAEALLAAMITGEGTRKVITEGELIEDVTHEHGLKAAAITPVLETLVSDTKLVRRDRHRQAVTYEIVSEFLVPWIRELRAARALSRTRRKLVRSGVAALIVISLIAGAFYYWRIASLNREELVRRADARAVEAEEALRRIADAPNASAQLKESLAEIENVRTQRDRVTRERDQANTRLATEQKRIAELEYKLELATDRNEDVQDRLTRYQQTVDTLNGRIATLEKQVADLKQKQSAAQEQTSGAPRTASVEVRVVDHNGKTDPRVVAGEPKYIASVTPLDGGPTQSYPLTGSSVMARVDPGRYRVEVKGLNAPAQEFARRAGEAGTLTFRPTIDVQDVIAILEPGTSQMAPELRRLAEKAWGKMSVDDKAQFLNVYSIARLSTVNERRLVSYFGEVVERGYNQDLNSLGIRIRVTSPLARGGFGSPSGLSMRYVPESGDVVFFAIEPLRDRYVREEEIRHAARIHQILLARGVQPLFDIVLRGDPRFPNR